MSAVRKKHLGHRIQLHGDIAGDGQAYCALCDRFKTPAHFDDHRSVNIRRYQRGLAALEHLGRVARVVRGARANLFSGLI